MCSLISALFASILSLTYSHTFSCTHTCTTHSGIRGLRAWQERFFVLSGNILSYWHSKDNVESDKPSGMCVYVHVSGNLLVFICIRCTFLHAHSPHLHTRSLLRHLDHQAGAAGGEGHPALQHALQRRHHHAADCRGRGDGVALALRLHQEGHQGVYRAVWVYVCM